MPSRKWLALSSSAQPSMNSGQDQRISPSLAGHSSRQRAKYCTAAVIAKFMPAAQRATSAHTSTVNQVGHHVSSCPHSSGRQDAPPLPSFITRLRPRARPNTNPWFERPFVNLTQSLIEIACAFSILTSQTHLRRFFPPLGRFSASQSQFAAKFTCWSRLCNTTG